MTIEITEFRCPTCGHILGEEQYVHACQYINRIVNEKAKEKDAIKEEQHRKEIQKLEEQHRKEIQKIDLYKKSEIESKVQQILIEEREATELKYNMELQEILRFEIICFIISV